MTPLPVLRLAVALASAATLTLAGCGDDGDVTSVPDDGNGAAPPKVAATLLDPVSRQSR